MTRIYSLRLVASLVPAVLACFALPVYAQSLEGVKRPEGEAKPEGYLPKGSVDYHDFVSPPPERGSLIDDLDMAISQRFQAEISSERWQVANLDSKMVYPRFEAALGKPINRRASPLLVRLLNRVMRDAADPVWNAKQYYQRPRPYQRYQLTRRCGDSPVPAPDKEPRGGSSYPSGHTVYGWATGLVLARVAPARSPFVLERARDYALSRVICGYHFSTDTEAARALASAVLQRLESHPAYQADLAAARTEYAATASPAGQAASPVPAVPAVPVEAEAQ